MHSNKEYKDIGMNRITTYRPLITYAISLALLASTPIALAKKEKKPKHEEHLVTSLGNEYLRAFVVEDVDDDEEDESESEKQDAQKSKQEILTFSVGEGKTVDVPLILELSPLDRYKVAFAILDVHVRQGKLPIHRTIDKTFIKTMELVYGGKDGKNSLVSDLNYSLSIIPETALAWSLAQPCPDIAMIKHNQAIIKELIAKPALYSQLQAKLRTLARLEERVLSFYTPHDTQFFNALNDLGAYPPFHKTSPKVVSISSGSQFFGFCCQAAVTGAFLGFGAVAITLGAVTKKGELAAGGIGSLAMGGLFGWLFHREYSQFSRVMRETQQRLIDLATYLDTLREIYQIICDTPSLKKHFMHTRYLHKLFEGHGSEPVNRLLNLLRHNTFKGNPSYIFSYTGRILATYALLQETKYELCDALMAGGQLGALMSATQLYLEHQHTPVQYSFVEFINSDRPYVKAVNAWNPRLDPQKAVPSSFELGGSAPYNMILTGGNGLGKSTVMKGLIYALIEAQTFGIAPAEQLVMAPFARMVCHTNVSDNIAAGLSGFTAELAMKDMILQEYTRLKPDQFVITVFDELFKSTNPDDAATLSKELCRTIAAYPNNMSIIATHLAPVTELEREGTHANYHPGFIPQGEGVPVKPTFTLEPGASFDHNAIALYNQGNR